MIHELVEEAGLTDGTEHSELADCSASGVEASVCADIASRQTLGLQKYGVSVEDNPLPLVEWLQHAYEETLDKAIYLKRAIEEIKENNSELGPASGSVKPFDNASDLLAHVRTEKQPTKQAVVLCGQALARCLQLGWEKDSLNDLEIIWWSCHDRHGNVISPNSKMRDRDE